MFIAPRHRDYELPPQRKVPLSMQVPLGIIFGVLTFLIAVFAIGMLVLTLTAKGGSDNSGGAGILVSGVLTLMCVYLARISHRLLKKQENQVEESSPRAIRIVSYIFLLIFLLAVLDTVRGTMALKNTPGLAFSLIGFLAFQNIARLRERRKHNQSSDPTLASVTPPAGQESRPR